MGKLIDTLKVLPMDKQIYELFDTWMDMITVPQIYTQINLMMDQLVKMFST